MLATEGPKAWANKTDIYFMIFNSIFVENCLLYDAIHYFLSWLIKGSIPEDNNLFSNLKNLKVLGNRPFSPCKTPRPFELTLVVGNY